MTTVQMTMSIKKVLLKLNDKTRQMSKDTL